MKRFNAAAKTKAEIVATDEKEKGVRALLNLGIRLVMQSRTAWGMGSGYMAKR